MSVPWKGGKVPWDVLPKRAQDKWINSIGANNLPDEWEALTRVEQITVLELFLLGAEALVVDLQAIIKRAKGQP